MIKTEGQVNDEIRMTKETCLQAYVQTRFMGAASESLCPGQSGQGTGEGWRTCGQRAGWHLAAGSRGVPPQSLWGKGVTTLPKLLAYLRRHEARGAKGTLAG